jgi:hypothetical protein
MLRRGHANRDEGVRIGLRVADSAVVARAGLEPATPRIGRDRSRVFLLETEISDGLGLARDSLRERMLRERWYSNEMGTSRVRSSAYSLNKRARIESPEVSPPLPTRCPTKSPVSPGSVTLADRAAMGSSPWCLDITDQESPLRAADSSEAMLSSSAHGQGVESGTATAHTPRPHCSDCDSCRAGREVHRSSFDNVTRSERIVVREQRASSRRMQPKKDVKIGR